MQCHEGETYQEKLAFGRWGGGTSGRRLIDAATLTCCRGSAARGRSVCGVVATRVWWQVCVEDQISHFPTACIAFQDHVVLPVFLNGLAGAGRQ